MDKNQDKMEDEDLKNKVENKAYNQQLFSK